MGHLIHGVNDYLVEDRLLAHLKIVISQKLGRQEAFFLSWSKSAAEGSGRVCLWVSPYVPLAFKFTADEPPELNRHWLRALNALSRSQHGLIAIDEDHAESFIKNNPDAY
ncbi:hypothetical protein ACFWHR_12295 [Leucobacter sp. NPDC058333]|uniref:DUF7882 family protein n=1 Tax=Leucobacter sp. NPDC058333 TaxID=3346450 RepID=UPI00365DC07B